MFIAHTYLGFCRSRGATCSRITHGAPNGALKRLVMMGYKHVAPTEQNPNINTKCQIARPRHQYKVGQIENAKYKVPSTKH